MTSRVPHASLDLCLAITAEGGRRGDVDMPTWKCRIAVASRFFDALIETDGRPLVLGSTRRVHVTFLDWASASKHLAIGTRLAIFELRNVGQARVATITDLERARA